MENFEEPLGDERRRLLEQELRKDLHQFLLSMKEADNRMPDELMTLTYIFPVYE